MSKKLLAKLQWDYGGIIKYYQPDKKGMCVSIDENGERRPSRHVKEVNADINRVTNSVLDDGWFTCSVFICRYYHRIIKPFI